MQRTEDRLRQASAFLREHAGRGQTLVIAPTRAAVDDLVRSCCEPALIGVHRHTLRDLVLRISSDPMNERGLVPVSRLTREALAALAANRARTAGSLDYLTPVLSFPGFPGALARTLEELRLNAVDPEQLRATGRSGPDLALLLDLYSGELGKHSLADHALRVELSMQAISRGEHALCGLPLLLLDVKVRSRAEERLIRALVDRSRAALSAQQTSTAAESTSLQFLHRFVLSGQPAPARVKDDTVQLFSASGEALECVEIARRILALASRGVRFDSVAVLLRSPERHQPLVSEAFARAGIPAFFSQGSRRPDPAGRALLALLRCKEEGLSASRFAEYLSLGQAPSADGEIHVPAAWERTLVDAAVVGGRERWERRLNGLLEQWSLQYEHAQVGSERDWLSRDIDRLQSLRGFALPIIQVLDELPSTGPWRVWLDAIAALVSSTLESPQSVQEVIEELRPLGEIGPVSLSEVLLTLAPALSTRRTEPADSRYGRVFVGSIEEARGMSFDAVFVPGLNEGVFPRPPREDPLLLDGQRETLGMPGSEDDADLLRAAVAAAGVQFSGSWSRLDLATGRERVPSFYAFELLAASGRGDIDVKAFEQEARSGSEARLGWPAPRDPEQAIDEAEWDLSYLHSQMNPPVRGAAFYLKTANAHLYRSLTARGWRWQRAWRWSDGLLPDDVHVGIALEKYRPAKHAFSPTELEQYARCPYRFLLRAIYYFRPARTAEAIQRMEPAMRGELHHAIQSSLLAKLREDGHLPVRAGNLDVALATLEVLLQHHANDAAERFAPAIPLVWEAEIERMRADLRGWLQHIASNETEWTPELFEWTFGGKLETPVRIFDEFLIQGRVDVLERHTSGAVRVTDHKTGKAPDVKPVAVAGGELLQPVLYGLAAESSLGESVAEARLFYSTIRQNYQQFPIMLSEQSRDAAQRVLSAVDKALHDGFLPAAPRKDACGRCEYRVVCGPYEEERTATGRKDQAPLRRLKEVRELP